MVFGKLMELKSDAVRTLESATKQVMAWYQGIEVLSLESYEIERYIATRGDSGTK